MGDVITWNMGAGLDDITRSMGGAGGVIRQNIEARGWIISRRGSGAWMMSST